MTLCLSILMRDKEVIRREIGELNLPRIVLQVFDGFVPHPALSYRCEEPHKCLSDGSGFPEHWLPLWECGVVVTAYDKATSTFCKVSLEDIDHPWFRSVDFDAVVADLLIDLWEDEISDAALAEIAEGFGFARIEGLIAALERGPDGNYEGWRAALPMDP